MENVEGMMKKLQVSAAEKKGLWIGDVKWGDQDYFDVGGGEAVVGEVGSSKLVGASIWGKICPMRDIHCKALTGRK
jgi:hypothetical protein